MDKKLSFSQALRLFDKYYAIMCGENKDFNRDLAMEARSKMEQLIWAISKIIKLDDRINKRSKSIFDRIKKGSYNGRKGRGVGVYSVELKFLTESFYYHAFRLTKIINSLPALKYTNKGISNVRNALLEHPEDNEKVYIVSFSTGGENGPVIKGPRYKNQIDVFPDKGLYVNTETLRDELAMMLKKFLLKHKLNSQYQDTVLKFLSEIKKGEL